jgi:hypothetical protein
VLPCLEPRLHVTGRAHLCHSCTRGLRPRVRPTGRTPPTGVPVAEPKCATCRAGAWGSPLIGKSTPHNGGLGRPLPPVTLAVGRGRGPCRQDSSGSHSSLSEELARPMRRARPGRDGGVRCGPKSARIPSCQCGVLRRVLRNGVETFKWCMVYYECMCICILMVVCIYVFC